MQREEDDGGSKGLAAFDLRSQIVERCDIYTAKAEAFAREMENCAPEFFARVGQRCDHERAGPEGDGSLWFLIKASAGNAAIVVCGGGKMQTEVGSYVPNLVG